MYIIYIIFMIYFRILNLLNIDYFQSNYYEKKWISVTSMVYVNLYLNFHLNFKLLNKFILKGENLMKDLYFCPRSKPVPSCLCTQRLPGSDNRSTEPKLSWIWHTWVSNLWMITGTTLLWHNRKIWFPYV